MNKYTLVQHSATSTGHTEFSHAVEMVGITAAQCAKVASVGGLILNSYDEAAAREMSENYPPGLEGMIPRAPGTFHPKLTVDGLAVYLPS